MSFLLGESNKSIEEADHKCPYVFAFSVLRGINVRVWKVRVKNSMTKTTIANKGLSNQAYGFSSGHVWM